MGEKGGDVWGNRENGGQLILAHSPGGSHAKQRGSYRGDPGKNSADPIIFHPLLKTAYAAQKEEKATFFDFVFGPKWLVLGRPCLLNLEYLTVISMHAGFLDGKP